MQQTPSTPAQIESNRANAPASTGPRDASVSRFNAVKHGFLSREVVLPTESRRAFRSHADSFWRAIGPRDHLEETLTDMLISSVWRLRRLHRLERELLQRGLPRRAQPPITLKDVIVECCRLEEADKARARGEQPPQPEPFQQPQGPAPKPVDYETLERLARYEAVLQRNFHRALVSLMRLRLLVNLRIR